MARADAKYSVTLEDRTQQALRRIQGNLGGLHSAFGKLSLAAGALSGIGGGGFLLMTKRALEGADAIAKSADAAGLSTDKYQEYTDALSFAGITTETFNSVTVAFVKRVGEARNGVGPLVSGLKGVNDELLAGIVNAKNQDEALDLVFDAMGRAGDAAERAAIANAAFSRTGVVLARSVKDGTEALRANMKAARDSGRVIEEEYLRSAEAANDAMASFQKTLGANFTRVLVANAEGIKSLADSFNDLIPEIVSAANAAVQFFDALHVSDSERIEARLSDLGVLMGRTAVDVAEYQRQVDALAQRLGQTRVESMPIFQRLQEARRDLEELQRLRAELEKQIAPPPAPLPPGPVIESIEIATVEDQAAAAAMAERERQFAITQEFQAGLIERQRAAAMWVQWDAQEQAKRAETEAAVQAQISNLQQVAAANFGQITAFIATQSKDAARAVLVVQKGLAAAEVIVNTEAAIARTAAELGPIASPPVIAALRAQRNVSLAAIAGATLTGLSGINGGGSSGGAGGNPAAPGGSLNPVITTPEPRSQRVYNISLYGWIDTTEGRRVLIDIIREADGNDEVFLSAVNGNAQAIRSGV